MNATMTTSETHWNLGLTLAQAAKTIMSILPTITLRWHAACGVLV